MENAADAIKIAFGLLVFAIAITLTFSVVGQARITSDTVFKATDKTAFYDYADEGDYNTRVDRIVSFETMLPTIHRYAKEQYAVTIFDTDGTPIVRYDLYTEGFMQNWNETIKNIQNKPENTQIGKEARQAYSNVETRLQQVQSVVNKELRTNVNIMDYIGTNKTIVNNANRLLYHGKTDVSTVNIVAPWVGEPDTDTVKRIQADLNGGNYVKNYGSYQITYYGKNLKQYKDREFKEKFIEIATSGETLTDGNDSIETIRGNKKLEIIYIMQER